MDHTLNLPVKTEAMLEELRAIVTRLGPDVLGRLAGLEPAEVVASPYGLRAVLLGLEQGATSVHLERRLELPWPESFTTSPEVASDPHAFWDAGVWQMGKYRGFFPDAPFGTFNPNHVAKWGPHELMHRAMGFFARPGASRWEHYLGARLNELVPVALWYGHDQFLRLREGEFDIAQTARHAEWAHVDWLGGDVGARVEQERAALKRGRAHFEREMEAIERELATGRVHATPRRFGGASLDASSDAIAYVVGHYERLVSAPFVSLLDEVLVEGVHYFSDIARYAAHVREVFERLDRGPAPQLDRVAVESAQRRRWVWDLAWRMAHHARVREGALHEALREAGRLVRSQDEVTAASVREWWGDACAALPMSARASVSATGLPSTEPSDAVRAHITDGLSSIAPAFVEALVVVEALDELLDELLGQPPVRAPLAERVDACAALKSLPESLSALWSFERTLASVRRRDMSVERLAASEPLSAEDWLIRSEAFVCVELACDVAGEHAAWSDGDALDWAAMAADDEPEPSAAYLVGHLGEGVAVLPAPPSVVLLWRRLGVAEACSVEEALSLMATASSHHPAVALEGADAWLGELLAAGAARAAPRLPRG